MKKQENRKLVNTVKMKKQCISGKDKVTVKKMYFGITIVNSSAENVSVTFLVINV